MSLSKNDRQNPLMIKLIRAHRKVEKYVPKQIRERFEDYEVKRLIKSAFNGAMDNGKPKLPKD